jgi:hypothetical protein
VDKDGVEIALELDSFVGGPGRSSVGIVNKPHDFPLICVGDPRQGLDSFGRLTTTGPGYQTPGPSGPVLPGGKPIR